MLPHEAASTYYDRACKQFYGNDESNLLPTLKAIMLFYWFAPHAPSVMNRNSSWWWTSVVIRHAQQAGIHNDYRPGDPGAELDPGLHRRIWWTVFVSFSCYESIISIIIIIMLTVSARAARDLPRYVRESHA